METSKDKVSLEYFKRVQSLVEYMTESYRRMEQASTLLLECLERIYGSKID